MKIIYLYLRRHCYNYDNEMFQYYVFRNRGYNLEVWSAVNWTFCDKKLESPLNCDTSNYCFYINTEKDLIDNINRVKDETCYFFIYPYHDKSFVSWTIRRRIKKSGFLYCNITEDPNISISNVDIPLKPNFMRCFVGELKNLCKVLIKFIISLIKFTPNFKIVYLWFCNFFYPYIYKSDRNYVTTSILFDSFPNKLESFSKRNIFVHSSVYDESLQHSTIHNEQYVVFIDQFLSGHSDVKKSGGKHPVQELSVYLQRLNQLFSKIEEVFSYQVVIAAHPKAEYDSNTFGKRMIVYNKTEELVSKSLFVIIQFSTCFGNVVLHKKDFLNIYDKDFFMNVPNLKDTYDAIKQFFNCKQLDISDSSQIKMFEKYIYKYNKQYYDLYEERYIKSRFSTSKDKLFYEVVEERIAEL